MEGLDAPHPFVEGEGKVESREIMTVMTGDGPLKSYSWVQGLDPLFLSCATVWVSYWTSLHLSSLFCRMDIRAGQL